MSLAFEQAEFIAGARVPSRFPPDLGREVAFAGRSNAGKSSVLNALTGRQALARTSKQPGRTREVNFFRLTEDRRLVDLPGYGFARVPAAIQRQWELTLRRYLAERASLAGLVVVMDIRHAFRDLDLHLLEWAEAARLPVHLLLTKADKLGRGRQNEALRAARGRCGEMASGVSVQLFSAPKKLGVDALRERVAQWLGEAQ